MSQKEDKSITFEEALANLEKIVAAIEQGTIPLEQSIEKYAEGMKLIGHCRGVLDQAEKRIEEIGRADSGDGQDKK